MNQATNTATFTPRAKALRADLTPAFFFTSALRQIESKSIRTWAVGNRAVWLTIARSWLAKHGDECTAVDAIARFATYITLTAMG